MIVDTMSYKELCREYDRIHEKYYLRAEKRLSIGGDDYNLIRRYMIKHRTQQDVLGKPLTFKVDNNTTFYAVPVISDYRTFCNIGPCAITFLTYNLGGGLNAIIRGGSNDNQYAFIRPHFFDRYIERFKDDEISKTKAIVEFITNNTVFIVKPYPTEKHPNNMIGSINDVIYFCEMPSDNITIIKTCITREQLKGSQTEIAQELDGLVDSMDEAREKLLEILVKNRNNPRVHIPYY